ncbi:selenium-binding protein SBP56-related protein [Scytonema sp. NUACC26]|uniref:selenium-binding protein SBP56-related protein n=1 Tax=Scytonema sp. NUACC26 TaxID=3140176 RepID=UPI0034DC5267
MQFKRTFLVFVLVFLLGLLGTLVTVSSVRAFKINTRPTEISSKYLLVWSSDKGTDDGKQDPDFLAVINADPKSPTYGKVVNTAVPPCIPGANLVDELGLAPGTPSCKLNEAHHITHKLWRDPVTKHQYLFVGGLISANIFKFDVTDPLNIPPATMVVTSRDVKKFAGTDDLMQLPNGNLIATYMGAKDLTTPGGLVEFSPNGGVVAEYDAAESLGPTRYVPSIKGVTDTGLLAHPHGLDIRPDLNVLVTSDYADPISLASVNTAIPANNVQDLGTTVRVWELSNLAAGPQKIIQVPDGPRKEENRIHEEPEGLMSFELLHQPQHRGAFTASMCGGVLYYSPDITDANPTFTEVYDAGPCTGVSIFRITNDDNFLLMPIAGIESPGDPEYNRDYSTEHSRRVVVLDLRPLINNRSDSIQCGPPSVNNDPGTGFTTEFVGRNNGAPDCPIEVAQINVDSPLNFETHGGPHTLQLDKKGTVFAFSNYFVDLNNFGLPGSGSSGDLKVYLANFQLKTGDASLDSNFKDELTGEVGVNFNRPDTYSWSGARGKGGAAKPHAMIFVEPSDLLALSRDRAFLH